MSVGSGSTETIDEKMLGRLTRYEEIIEERNYEEI